jgi:hypothetical protein
MLVPPATAPAEQGHQGPNPPVALESRRSWRGPSRSHFDLVSHWCLPAAPPAVWQALIDVHAWPSWWPYVKEVQTLREGDSHGVGAMRLIHWRTRLGYSLKLRVQAVELVRHERLRGRSQGSLQGEGIWLLRADEHIADVTHVTYVWRVVLDTVWLRLTAPLLAPLFRWSHESVMRSGHLGLCKHLASKSKANP